MSVGREDVACYRLYAVNCVELAQGVLDPDRRLFLLRMAQAWGQLAKQVEEHAAADGQTPSTGAPGEPSPDRGNAATPHSK